MRFLSIICAVGMAFTFPISANAAKAKSGGGGQDLGAIRDQCRAQATGRGMSKQAEVKACVQRAKGGGR
jgi:hypothetical protein